MPRSLSLVPMSCRLVSPARGHSRAGRARLRPVRSIASLVRLGAISGSGQVMSPLTQSPLYSTLTYCDSLTEQVKPPCYLDARDYTAIRCVTGTSSGTHCAGHPSTSHLSTFPANPAHFTSLSPECREISCPRSGVGTAFPAAPRPEGPDAAERRKPTVPRRSVGARISRVLRPPALTRTRFPCYSLHESDSSSRTGATYAGSTTTSVFTELAMKQAWWACSWRFASSSGVGVFSASNRTCGRKVTLIMANRPA